VRLNFPRGQLGSVDALRLGLAKPGLKNFVDGDAISVAIFGRCEQRTVLNSNNLQFLHEDKPSRDYRWLQDCHELVPFRGNTPGVPQVVSSCPNKKVGGRFAIPSGLLETVAADFVFRRN
jgi:hypothetical protein